MSRDDMLVSSELLFGLADPQANPASEELQYRKEGVLQAVQAITKEVEKNPEVRCGCGGGTYTIGCGVAHRVALLVMFRC